MTTLVDAPIVRPRPLRAPAGAGGDRATGADARPPRRRADDGVDRRRARRGRARRATWRRGCTRATSSSSTRRRRSRPPIDATTPGGQPVVVHLSTELPTGLHLVEVRRTTAARRRRSPTRAITPASRWRSPAAARCASSGGCPARCACGSPRSTCRRRCSSTCCRFGRPIRYGYVPDSWPITAYTNSFAREPGSAEMPSAGRVADGGRDHRPRRQRHRRRPDRAAHRRRLAGGPRDAVPGALPRAGRDGPPRQRHPRRRRARRGRRHDGRAGAGDRRRRRRRRPSRRGLDRARRSRRPAACGSSTACSPAGTSPRPATCRCSRRSPGGGRWSLRTGRRSQQGIDGMSSATST